MHPFLLLLSEGEAFHGTNWSVQAIIAEVLPQGLSFSFSLFLAFSPPPTPGLLLSFAISSKQPVSVN